MINALPKALSGIGYYQGLSLILWIIAVIILFVNASLFLFRGLKVERDVKKGYLAWSIFSLLYAVCRIFYLIAVHISQYYDLFASIGYIFGISSLISILYLIESQIFTSTKKFFTIITTVAFGISLLSLLDLSNRYFTLILLSIIGVFSSLLIVFMYLYLVFKTRDTARRKAFMIFIAVIFILISHFIDSPMFITVFPLVPLEVPPILMIFGLFLLLYANLFYKLD
ncbi:MAG: hypothetical protein GF383_04655 [Candidatus Lokiarchaeota archaeon]|nr:hypothetical protein [Candidatus Lokiarchaeota archaeon]MBD3339085.1 hypothetical protein [Candidatus Lokiarchaeota archaeon]